MHQAVQATTTRRALFAAAPALVLAIPAVAAAAASPLRSDWQEFLNSHAVGWPSLAETVHRTNRAGYAAKDIVLISFHGEAPKEDYPILFFDAHNGGHHTVTRRGGLHCTWAA